MTPTVGHTPDVATRAARALSKALFGGAQYRIEIGAAIAAKKLVNTAELSSELGIVRQSVNHELRILEEIGLLARVPPDPQIGDSARKVFLRPADSEYWAWCEEALSKAPEMLRRKERF